LQIANCKYNIYEKLHCVLLMVKLGISFRNTTYLSKYSLDKIICLDETSIQPPLLPIYSKCSLGKRSVALTKS